MRRAFILCLLMPVVLLAHAGEPLAPHDLLAAWRFNPGVVIPLAITAFLYARGARLSRGVSSRQIACFWTGWASLTLALISPLHPLGEVLFSAHMLQHEILMLASAPLLVISRPLVPMLWGLPFGSRRIAGRWSKHSWIELAWHRMTGSLSAWWIHAAAIWFWHMPPMFQATLTSEWAHTAQHISFLLSALLFWWSLLYAHGRLSYGASVLYVFTTSIHTAILGALLTLAPTLWYPDYAQRTAAWGLDPLRDQQIGGLVMWVPAGLVYLGVGLLLLVEWLRESEAIVARRWYAQ